MSALKRVQQITLGAFLFLTPLAYSYDIQLYIDPRYLKMILAIVGVSLLLLLWVIDMWTRKFDAVRVPLPFLGGLALWVISGLSLLSASNLQVGLESLGAFTAFLLLYFMLSDYAEKESRVLWMVACLFTSAVVAALLGLFQYYGFDPIHGASQLGPLGMISVMGNKNDLASFLTYMYAPSFILLIKAKRVWWRALVFAGLILLFAAIMADNSRSAWFGLTGALLLAGVALWRYAALKPIQQRRGWFLGLALSMAVIALIYVTPNALNFWARGGAAPLRAPRVYEEVASASARPLFWLVGLEMVKARPVLGVGLGHYKLEYVEYKARFFQGAGREAYANLWDLPRAAQAHNEYVQIWAELGMVGLLTGLVSVLLVFYCAWRMLRIAAAEEQRFAISALLAGFTALLLDSLFQFPLHLPAPALAFTVVLALLSSSHFRCPALTFRADRVTKWSLALGLIPLALVMATVYGRDLLATVYRERGNDALLKNQLDRAQLLYVRSLGLALVPGATLLNLGGLAELRDKPELALNYFKESEKYLRWEGIYASLAKVSLELQQPEWRQYAEKLISINPKAPQVAVLRPLIEELDAAEEIQTELRKLYDAGEYEEAYLRLGDFYRGRGKLETAVEMYTKALKAIALHLEQRQNQLSSAHKGSATALQPQELEAQIARLQRQKQQALDALEALGVPGEPASPTGK